MKFLAAVFLMTILILLIGGRFGFTWAGGSGYETPLTASVNSKALARGDTVETGDFEKTVIYIGQNIFIALDQRTTILIEQLLPSQVEIKITRGRLLAKTSSETEKLIISSPETSDFITRGSITAVRYDWLGQTEIARFDEFDWENSSAREFYEWATNTASSLRAPREAI